MHVHIANVLLEHISRKSTYRKLLRRGEETMGELTDLPRQLPSLLSAVLVGVEYSSKSRTRASACNINRN